MGESSELFVNCLEAMVETCLPLEENSTVPPSPKPYNLSSSLSSLTLGSPTDKGKLNEQHNKKIRNNDFEFEKKKISAFSTESLDCHDNFSGSVSSLRRTSCGKNRPTKHRITNDSPTQGINKNI